MKMTLTIEDPTQELLAFLSGKHVQATVSTNGTAKESTKVEAKEEAKVDGGAPTLDELKTIVLQKGQAGKRDEVKRILGEFGAPKLTELDAKHYGAFKAKVIDL